MLVSRPLALQTVDPTDSMLGPFAESGTATASSSQYYADLIKKAFEPNTGRRPAATDRQTGSAAGAAAGYTQMEQNFSMFWGISIMLYEQTLISDQSRFDDWFASCRPAVSNPGGPGSQAVPMANPIVTCRNAPPDPTASERRQASPRRRSWASACSTTAALASATPATQPAVVATR